jgi:hypothetical protein
MDALPGLRPRLPWQPACSEWLSTRKLAACFLDKRLGKCTEAIEWAIRTEVVKLQGGFSNLIVAPPSAIGDWLVELEADSQQYSLLYGTREERLEEMARGLGSYYENGRRFFVTNPQGLFLPKGKTRRHAEPTEIATYDWDSVIWDECTYALWNPQSQTNEIAFDYLARAPRKLILSGEPCPEGPHQIFEPMRWVYGAFMGHTNFWDWQRENFKKVGFEWYPLPGRLSAIKESYGAKSYYLSRKAAGLDSQKPTFERVWVDLPQKVRAAYDHCERFMDVPYGGDEPVRIGGGETKFSVVSKNWLSQMAGGYPKDFPALHSQHKVKAVHELVSGRFKGDSVVVTWRYNAEVKACFDYLREHGIGSCAVVWGATSLPDRKRLQARFNNGSLRVLVMQVKCAMHGLNLAMNCNTMVRGSLPDRWEEISQPMDRIFHPAIPGVRAYVDIVARDTVDEDRLNAAGDKQVNSRFFMTNFAKNFQLRKERKYGKRVA